MRATRTLLEGYKPMIRFLGKRRTPDNIDHTPRPHPASPSNSLPSSFSSYRQEATSHGPLKTSSSSSSSSSTSSSAPTSSQTSGFRDRLLSGRSGKSLGSVAARDGQFFDRDELPARFRRAAGVMAMSEGEIEAIESGGASFW